MRRLIRINAGILATIAAFIVASVKIDSDTSASNHAVLLSELTLISTRGMLPSYSSWDSKTNCCSNQTSGKLLTQTCFCSPAPDARDCYACTGASAVPSGYYNPNGIAPIQPLGSNQDCDVYTLTKGTCANGSCNLPVAVGQCPGTFPPFTDQWIAMDQRRSSRFGIE